MGLQQFVGLALIFLSMAMFSSGVSVFVVYLVFFSQPKVVPHVGRRRRTHPQVLPLPLSHRPTMSLPTQITRQGTRVRIF